jgi:hypothetical protein
LADELGAGVTGFIDHRITHERKPHCSMFRDYPLQEPSEASVSTPPIHTGSLKIFYGVCDTVGMEDAPTSASETGATGLGVLSASRPPRRGSCPLI